MEQLLSAKPCGKSSTRIIPNPYNNPGGYPHFTAEHTGTFLISSRPVSPGTFLV